MITHNVNNDRHDDDSDQGTRNFLRYLGLNVMIRILMIPITNAQGLTVSNAPKYATFRDEIGGDFIHSQSK